MEEKINEMVHMCDTSTIVNWTGNVVSYDIWLLSKRVKKKTHIDNVQLEYSETHTNIRSWSPEKTLYTHTTISELLIVRNLEYYKQRAMVEGGCVSSGVCTNLRKKDKSLLYIYIIGFYAWINSAVQLGQNWITEWVNYKK